MIQCSMLYFRYMHPCLALMCVQFISQSFPLPACPTFLIPQVCVKVVNPLDFQPQGAATAAHSPIELYLCGSGISNRVAAPTAIPTEHATWLAMVRWELIPWRISGLRPLNKVGGKTCQNITASQAGHLWKQVSEASEETEIRTDRERVERQKDKERQTCQKK